MTAGCSPVAVMRCWPNQLAPVPRDSRVSRSATRKMAGLGFQPGLWSRRACEQDGFLDLQRGPMCPDAPPPISK